MMGGMYGMPPQQMGYPRPGMMGPRPGMPMMGMPGMNPMMQQKGGMPPQMMQQKGNPMMGQKGGMPPQMQQQMQRPPQMQQGPGPQRPPQQQQSMPGPNEPLTAAALAAAPPGMQKQMLGEKLFPLISRFQPELAGKITGMMLEMDNSELLILLESEAALKTKVDEAR